MKFIKYKKLFLAYMLINFSLLSLELLSSNGVNYFKFNEKNNRVENIDLDFEKESYDIDFIKIGFFLKGKQYEIGELPYELLLSENSNIIELLGNFENTKYKISMYSSMLNKDIIVFHTELLAYQKSDNLSFYYYIKPKNMGKLRQEKDYFVFNDISFQGKDIKVYLAENLEIKNKKLKVVAKESFVSTNEGLFAILPFDSSKNSETYFTIQKNGSYKNTIEEEVNNWEKQLASYKYKDLYSNLKMFINKGVIVDAYKEVPIVDVSQLLKYLELSLLKKDYDLAKSILEYAIFSINPNLEGIIPSDYIDIKGNSLSRKDNYGIYNSYYKRSVFLKLYLTYLMESNDKNFYNKTYPLVKTRLIDWLENKIGEKGVEVDSGDGRIGKDGYKAFVETQYETYKSFKLLNQYFQKQGIKEDKYKKISEKLKEILILYYVDGVYIADYPFAKNINPKNIFYVDEDLFLTQNEYYKALQKNIDLLKKEKSSLKEKIVFVNYLYDKKYYLMADFMREEIEKELEGYKGIELLQKDLELLLNYLIMKEKGEKYGLNK